MGDNLEAARTSHDISDLIPPGNRSASAAGRVVAGGFAGRAGAANDEFALEPGLVGLIGGLLLLVLALRLNLPVSLGRRSFERAEDDFSLGPRRLVWL
jgi:hypothetical protein